MRIMLMIICILFREHSGVLVDILRGTLITRHFISFLVGVDVCGSYSRAFRDAGVLKRPLTDKEIVYALQLWQDAYAAHVALHRA